MQQKPKEGANPLSGGQSRTKKEDSTSFTPRGAFATFLFGVGKYALFSSFAPFFKNRTFLLDFRCDPGTKLRANTELTPALRPRHQIVVRTRITMCVIKAM